jgi:hypothetical protein
MCVDIVAHGPASSFGGVDESARRAAWLRPAGE